MDAPTPTAAGLRHRAATRRRARFGLLAFTAASVAFNVSVILQLPDYTMQRLALAALAPITQAYMGHLLAGYLQSDMLPSGTTEKVNKWTRWAVVAIALGAFALSFQTLYAAAKPDHGKWAFIFPLTLDLAIAVCTWMLVVIARADERDQAAGVQPHPGWWSRRAIQRNPSTVQAEAVAPLRMGQLHHDPAVHPDARTVERPRTCHGHAHHRARGAVAPPPRGARDPDRPTRNADGARPRRGAPHRTRGAADPDRPAAGAP